MATSVEVIVGVGGRRRRRRRRREREREREWAAKIGAINSVNTVLYTDDSKRLQ